MLGSYYKKKQYSSVFPSSQGGLLLEWSSSQHIKSDVYFRYGCILAQEIEEKTW